jgi:hypothetical protein
LIEGRRIHEENFFLIANEKKKKQNKMNLKENLVLFDSRHSKYKVSTKKKIFFEQTINCPDEGEESDIGRPVLD